MENEAMIKKPTMNEAGNPSIVKRFANEYATKTTPKDFSK